MRSRSEVLETAVLGLLNESPLHGYELRKRLNLLLGSFRAFSYGSLYPALKNLSRRGLIATTDGDPEPPSGTKGSGRLPGGRGKAGKPGPLAGRRGRIVYELTAEGKEHLHHLLASSGPAAWEDENFDVRFALFAQTDAETRLRILEGRRSRLTERLEAVREASGRTRSRVDECTRELQRFGQEKVEREVSWLDSLIRTERDRASRPAGSARQEVPAAPGTPPEPPTEDPSQ